MAFLRRHGFSIFIGLLLAAFVFVSAVIVAAPKLDAQNRGFVACTKELARRLNSCDRQILCSGTAILQNTWCDLKVIGSGFYAWHQGRQPLPWSNYLYEPEIPVDSLIDEDARQEYLKKHPNVSSEMKNLHRLRKELENVQNSQNAPELWPEE